MKEENENYNKVIRILRKSKPELKGIEIIEENVIKQIKKTQNRHNHTQDLIEALFSWIYIGWVRKSLVAASIFLVLFFVYQQTLILKGVNSISKQTTVNGSGTFPVSEEDLGKQLMMYRLNRRRLPSTDLEISEKQVRELLDSYRELQDKYSGLVKIIEEDSVLREYIERKLDEIKTEREKLIFKVMKYKNLKMITAGALVLIASCNDPKTVVTDIVHDDGSITRKIEMKNSENNFKVPEIQVPFDNTWTVRDSLEINEKGDTTWVKRAEKLFKNAEDINRDYKADSSYNKGISRKVAFSKNFKWFHTNYRFAEIIDKKLLHGYPVSDFLNKEEQGWFYSPENVKNKKENSVDSLKFKMLNDSVEAKTEIWFFKNIVSEWIGEFGKQISVKSPSGIDIDSLRSREDELVKVIEKIDESEQNFDSLWNRGLILKDFIGEANALRYKEEADSALNLATESIFVTFRQYAVKMIMPGKVTGSNGFIDSTGILFWPVNSDFFLTEPYEMWAESKVPNLWAWIISGLFVVFVFTGIMVTNKRKG